MVAQDLSDRRHGRHFEHMPAVSDKGGDFKKKRYDEIERFSLGSSVFRSNLPLLDSSLLSHRRSFSWIVVQLTQRSDAIFRRLDRFVFSGDRGGGFSDIEWTGF